MLSPLDELRILEGSSAYRDHVGIGRISPAVPRIAGVAWLGCPMIRGELDATLAYREEVHVFDALTGEDLGAASVNCRWWSLEDTRDLSAEESVVYVARLIDAEGRAGALSNAWEFVFDRPVVAMCSPGEEVSVFADEMSESSALVNVAWITDVTPQLRKATQAQSRKRSGDAKVTVECCRIINGTLSSALRAGETVHVHDGSIDLGCASVRGKAWTFCDARLLRAGSPLSYTAHVADAAGNLGPSSSIYMMTVGATND